MDILTVLYGTMAALTVVVSFLSRKMTHAPVAGLLGAALVAGAWPVTMAGHFLGSYEGQILLFPMLHGLSFIAFFGLWWRKQQLWMVSMFTLFGLALCTDLDFDIDYGFGRVAHGELRTYLIAQNLLFVLRLLLVWSIHGRAWWRSVVPRDATDFTVGRGGLSVGRGVPYEHGHQSPRQEPTT